MFLPFKRCQFSVLGGDPCRPRGERDGSVYLCRRHSSAGGVYLYRRNLSSDESRSVRLSLKCW